MICPFGGFPTIRHNELRDIIGNLLSEVCSNMAIEPSLQPLSGEVLLSWTTTTSQEAWSDIRTTGFWTRMEDAFFDIRVSHANAPSNQSSTFEVTMSMWASRAPQAARVWNGLSMWIAVRFSLWFSQPQAQAHHCARTFYNASQARSLYRDCATYSDMMAFVRSRITLALLRSSIHMCFRGSWSSWHSPTFENRQLSMAESPGGGGGGGGEAVVRHCITNCVHLFCETLWSLTLLVIITMAKRMFFVRFCTCFFL